MDSDYVISKSEDHLAPPFLQFCKKYDICNLSRGALTGAFGKSTRIKSSLYFRFILGNTPPVPVYTGFFQNFIEPIATITISDIRSSA